MGAMVHIRGPLPTHNSRADSELAIKHSTKVRPVKLDGLFSELEHIVRTMVVHKGGARLFGAAPSMSGTEKQPLRSINSQDFLG